jgi:hypothetical protein
MIWRAFFSALLRPILSAVALAASWFGGRKAAATDIKLATTERTLRVVRRTEEIENEVQALDRDTLKSRSRRWVRGANGK